MTLETVPTFSTVPVTLSHTTLEPITEMGETSVLTNTKTMAGVVHELAKNSACTKLGATQQSSLKSADTTEQMKDTEQPKKSPDVLQIDKTQVDEDEEPRKKRSGLIKAILGASTDFPYYSGKLGSINSLRSKRSSTASSMSYGTNQGNKTESGTSVAKETSPKPESNKLHYNVYELRRIAEEQCKVAETEEACELIRNRQLERKKHELEKPALPKKIAQLQKFEKIGDSLSYKDQM